MALSKTKVLKDKKCKVCDSKFTPFHSFQKFCSPDCGYELSQQELKKKRSKEARKAKREYLNNDVSHWRKKAQQTFNKYIRLRDKDCGCISCGNPFNSKYDAGHYRSVGANPALRFDPLNCWGQCVKCNQHLSGNLVDYRINLVKKIGLEAVEILEGPHEPKRYRLEDYKQIHREYSEKIKEIENDSR